MQKNNTLNSLSLLAFSFVAIVVIINLFTTNNYGRSNREVAELLQQTDPILNYAELHRLLESTALLPVDLRSEAEFQQGHLPGAINIPLPDLLHSNHLRSLRRTQAGTIVLYAGHEAEAHAAHTLLLAIGLDNTLRVLGGNYDSAVRYVTENFNPAFAAYRDEKARFDYRRFMGTGTAAPTERGPGIIPAIQTTTPPAGGGC